jgi:hypothetical protein
MTTHDQYFQDIATALGDPWRLRDTDQEYGVQRAWLADPAGPVLRLSVEREHWKRPDAPARLTVTGLWPEPDPGQGYQPYGEDRTIGVAVSRGADVAAKEISRRLLPWYLAEYARQWQHKQDHHAHVAGLLETARALAAIVGYTPPERPTWASGTGDRWESDAWHGPLRLWVHHVEVTVAGPDLVHIDLHGLTRRHAAMVLRGLVKASIGLDVKGADV